MKNNIKGMLKGSIFFLLLIILTFYIIFKNNDINNIITIISKVKIKYIFLAITCMIIFICCEGINIGRTLKLLGNPINFYRKIKYALVGFFFSSITPSATGGDPMQLYYMKKDKINLSHATLALLIELSSFQLVIIVLSIIGFFLNITFLTTEIGNIKILLFLFYYY